jgi:hypothetical protein
MTLAGPHAGCGFPITTGQEITGVIEGVGAGRQVGARRRRLALGAAPRGENSARRPR